MFSKYKPGLFFRPGFSFLQKKYLFSFPRDSSASLGMTEVVLKTLCLEWREWKNVLFVMSDSGRPLVAPTKTPHHGASLK